MYTCGNICHNYENNKIIHNTYLYIYKCRNKTQTQAYNKIYVYTPNQSHSFNGKPI